MVPLPPPELPTWLIATIVGVDTVIRLVALGVVPRHRRASTSTAWLLIIFPVPFLGVPLYLVFGSWWAMGRALDDDPKASGIVKELLAAAPGWTPHAHEATAAIMRMNRETTRFGETTGSVGGLYNAPAEAFAAMADAVDRATHHVHVLYYQTSWDDDTAVLYEALQRAAARGVVVRLLVDHHGLRSIPGWREFRDRLDASGLQWHVMLPFNPFKGPVRRPDLRNHRKLLVVDSRTAFVGSHNLVAADYDTPAYAEAGAAIVTTHIEATAAPFRLADELHRLGAGAGIALRPTTPLSAVEHLLGRIDLLLLMTVEPGFGGQSFIEAMLPKIERARRLVSEEGLELRIQIDGGVTASTIERAAEAGAGVFVAGSAVYGADDAPAAIARLRDLAAAHTR